MKDFLNQSVFVFKDLRSQFRSLNHLPLTCEFQIIEVRLHPPLISPATTQFFTGKSLSSFIPEETSSLQMKFIVVVNFEPAKNA